MSASWVIGLSAVLRYSSRVPSGDQNGWPSLTRNEFVRRVSSLPSAFMTYSSLLPFRRLLKAMRRPSGDQADWASSARTSVSWTCGRPNDGIAKMSPLSAVPKRFELNDTQPFSPGHDACADAGAMAAATPTMTTDSARRRRRRAVERENMVEAPLRRRQNVERLWNERGARRFRG